MNIVKSHPDLGFGNINKSYLEKIDKKIFNDVSNLINVNNGFGSTENIILAGKNNKYRNYFDTGFGSPSLTQTFQDLTFTRNFVVEFEDIFETGRITLLPQEIKFILFKNNKYKNPNILVKAINKNTIIEVKNITSAGFEIQNKYLTYLIVNYVITENISILSEIDTDKDNISDLNEVIYGTNPFVKYI